MASLELSSCDHITKPPSPLLWSGLWRAQNLTRLRPGVPPRRGLCHLERLNFSKSLVETAVLLVIPTKAPTFWIPAVAGMTGESVRD
ncbi:MAG: hypothetical protein IPJ90_12555 [Anaerolineaceae bacterium]|nr:hypothetical protein [Anaerolineaceae bacterium]